MGWCLSPLRGFSFCFRPRFPGLTPRAISLPPLRGCRGTERRGATFNIVCPSHRADMNARESNNIENGTSTARGSYPHALEEEPPSGGVWMEIPNS